jgi:hypothetical protein
VIRKLREATNCWPKGRISPPWPASRGLTANLSPLEKPVRRQEGQYAKQLKGLERENGRLKHIVTRSSTQRCSKRWPRETSELGTPPQSGGQGKLLSSARRRKAVVMLLEHLGVSERRVCRPIGQPRDFPVSGIEEGHPHSASAGSLHLSSPSSGTKTNPDSHSLWTTNRGRVTSTMALMYDPFPVKRD